MTAHEITEAGAIRASGYWFATFDTGRGVIPLRGGDYMMVGGHQHAAAAHAGAVDPGATRDALPASARDDRGSLRVADGRRGFVAVAHGAHVARTLYVVRETAALATSTGNNSFGGERYDLVTRTPTARVVSVLDVRTTTTAITETSTSIVATNDLLCETRETTRSAREGPLQRDAEVHEPAPVFIGNAAREGVASRVMRRDAIDRSMDDGGRVHGYRWLPDGASSAVGQITHEMAAHGAQYARLAEVLAEQGYAVWAHDHRGHGKTATDERALGRLADDNGVDRVVTDLLGVRDAIGRAPRDAAEEGRPGGAQHGLVFDDGRALRAGALSLERRGALGLRRVGRRPGLGRQAAKLERLGQGGRGKSALLAALSFGSFNKDFEPTRHRL